MRLGTGALFLYTAEQGQADEEKNGLRKQPLLTSRLHVTPEGIVTILTGKIECGQGIRTTLTQVAAEELELSPAYVRLIMGDTDLVPDDGGTWGSLTTPETVPVIRQACAALRELLCRTAGAHWQVEPHTLAVVNGCIAGPSGATYCYRDLAADASFPTAINGGGQTKPPAQWQICGTSLPNVNGPSIVSGSHKYSSDLLSKSMVHGRVVRPPNHLCRLASLDASRAQSLPGVRVVHEGDFLGVTASSPALAKQAAELITAQWTQAALGDPGLLYANIKRNARPPKLKEFGRYPALLQQGSVSTEAGPDQRQFQSSYTIAPIAHVPLEARTAVARWQGDKLTVQCGTQAPFVVRAEIAKAMRVPEENVRIIVSDTGSGYGAKHNSECELEAARLARGTGQPLRLAWTREDEFAQSYSRPAALMEVRTLIEHNGQILTWEFHNYNGGAASLKPPYQIPNLYAAYHESESPLRQGSYRSLAATGNNFAREMHMDEIAASLAIDPLELRLRNTNNPRLKAVLERAAESFGWGKTKSGNGLGYGLACNVEKDGHLALFTELQVDGTTVNLIRMVAAFDVGAVVNPDVLSNQVEGAIIQGIGGALFEQIQYDQTKIVTRHLANYRVPRFTDIPEIEVILIDRRDVPSAGAGESPITATAPSIGSALFATTGIQVRHLPMLPALHTEVKLVPVL